MRTVIVIPARLAAQRLPHKPLAALGGLPLVVRVAQQAKKADVGPVIVATDSPQIVKAVEAHGHEARLTSPQHPSGTDRVAEVAAQLSAEVVINLQGDEPFIDPRDLVAVAEMLEDPELHMATLRVPLRSVDQLHDPNVVKVITNNRQHALYFSRAPIPYPRTNQGSVEGCFAHLGVYGYRREALLELASAPVHPLEEREKLEQLRALARGYRIGVQTAHTAARGIDTLADLERARAYVQALGEAAFVG